MVGFLIIAFIALADMVLLLKLVTSVLSLYDRFELNRVSKQLAKQLEEEEEYEKNKGKHSIN